ncbi:MAG: DUF6249 domain-containing protein [Flavobacteriales bacterium]
MEQLLISILVPVSCFAMIFGIIYVIYTTRNKERMALIEKGESAEIFNQGRKSEISGLKFGMLAIGIGLGVLFGYMFESMTQVSEEVAYFSMIFLTGGIALVLYHLITKKNDVNDVKQEQKNGSEEMPQGAG